MIENYIGAFNKKYTKLETDFDMASAIYNEAREYLDDYFDTDQYLLKPPQKNHFPASSRT